MATARLVDVSQPDVLAVVLRHRLIAVVALRVATVAVLLADATLVQHVAVNQLDVLLADVDCWVVAA